MEGKSSSKKKTISLLDNKFSNFSLAELEKPKEKTFLDFSSLFSFSALFAEAGMKTG
jgi:hypothetical protein